MASRLARFAACTSEYPSGSAPKGFALGARAGGSGDFLRFSPSDALSVPVAPPPFFSAATGGSDAARSDTPGGVSERAASFDAPSAGAERGGASESDAQGGASFARGA